MLQKNSEDSPIPPLIDIHSHHPNDADCTQIISLDTHGFGADSLIARQYPTQATKHAPHISIPDTDYFSLGIHPWFIDRQDLDTAFRNLETFKHHPRLLAIGECGLDKCIEQPLSSQIEVFTRQITLAERVGKPLIIHCVRAFSELLQLKKQLRPCRPWIIHGFTGKPALAAQLLKQGCHLSFGAALLNTDGFAAKALLRVPVDRLFLETDANITPIGAIYTAAAKIRGTEAASLRQQIHHNFSHLFLND